MTIGLRRSLALAILSLWSSAAMAGDADRPPRIDADAAGTGSVLANPLAARSIDRLSATRERPLFLPSRRPPELPPPVAQHIEPPPLLPPPSITLLGTVTEQEDAHAMLRSGTTTRRVRLGDDVGGWKVTEIETRRLVLSRDDRSAVFTLFGGEPPRPAAIAGPTPNVVAPAAKAIAIGNRPRPRNQARASDPTRSRALMRESLN